MPSREWSLRIQDINDLTSLHSQLQELLDNENNPKN